jgi:hypothetical protein
MSETMLPEPPITVCYVDHVEGRIIAFGHYSIGQPAPANPPVGVVRVEVSPTALGSAQSQPDAYHVADDLIEPREACPVTLSASSFNADGEAELVLSEIPSGAHLRVRGAVSLPWTLVEGGEVTLTATAPGRLVLELRCQPPHRNWTGVANAV